MKKLFVLLFLMCIPFVANSAVVTESYLSPAGVTVAKLDSNRLALTNAANTIDGALIQDESVTTDELDANANPENRWNEGFNDFVYTGLLPPTGTTNIVTTTSGTAYVDGVRVVKDATAHTYTVSKHTYVDLSATGTYTYSEVVIDAAEPSTTANSIRLARVSTDATKVSAVRDDRVTSITLAAGSVGSVADTDGDTMIQTEESDDEDIIRFDIEGTETVVFGDGTTEEMVAITNTGTDDGLRIDNSGILAAGNHGLVVTGNAATIAADSALVNILQDSVSATEPCIEIDNDGSGYAIEIQHEGTGNDIVVYINNAGGGNSIEDDSGAVLSAAGAWTDAPSIYNEKENITNLILGSYMDKVKNIKLYKYQKKQEIYGSKKDKIKNGKKVKEYSKEKKNPNARYYEGYILDDLTTPEELISRDAEGNINGLSAMQGVNFLLAVNKELIIKIEELEARINILESYH